MKKSQDNQVVAVVKPGDMVIVRVPADTSEFTRYAVQEILEVKFGISVAVLALDQVEVFNVAPPVTYGIWVVDGGHWYKTKSGRLVTFTNPTVGEATIKSTDWRGPVLLRRIYPGGYPLPADELPDNYSGPLRPTAARIVQGKYDSARSTASPFDADATLDTERRY